MQVYDRRPQRKKKVPLCGSISGFMYELDLMTFVIKIFLRHFLLTHTLDIIILDIIIY